ncbi:uncharacterized protein [Drosophila virilis]|uniref:Uncharacterized protein n=1 Tax=Drosophila virilis TaxID=7244 RepID=B4M9U8_DROVI|nr:uncharacterized protein LOC6634080 [Drosophila virilis]EDW57974.1 uncharacterized protein Dvir_GJ18384 [Drosophila virilis]
MPNVAALKLGPSFPFNQMSWPPSGLQVLDHLALQQQINANFILHAITNYKKSPFERKTLDFIDKKWLALLGLWREFRCRDRQIRRDYMNVEPQHGYFQQELYALIHEKYMAARSRMSRDKRNLLKCKASQA